MIRARFHGRGGQGMKTASRVVGTAAILDGFVAQDSPVYGAERRGAPVSAYVRFARTPIFERGVISVPDLVVVADDTLLDDPAAAPLAGLPPTGVLLLQTAHTPDATRRHTGHPGSLIARDYLAQALDAVGSAAGVSTALAGASARLLGLSAAATDDAIRRELGAIGISRPAIDAGLRLAAEARAGLEPLVEPTPPAARPGSPVVDIAYALPEVGAPTVLGEPNTPRRNTGSWRLYRPVIDLARCTRCWICFVRCPDGAIELEPDDTPRVDYDVCKGCLICVAECPTHAIAQVREAREWAETG